MINSSNAPNLNFSGIKLKRTADSASFITRGRSGFKADSHLPTQASSRADSLSRRALNEPFFNFNLDEIDRRLKTIIDGSIEMSPAEKDTTKQIMNQASAPAPLVAESPSVGNEGPQKSYHYIRTPDKNLFPKRPTAKGDTLSSKFESPFKMSSVQGIDISME